MNEVDKQYVSKAVRLAMKCGCNDCEAIMAIAGIARAEEDGADRAEAVIAAAKPMKVAFHLITMGDPEANEMIEAFNAALAEYEKGKT